MAQNSCAISIVLPVKNEAKGLQLLLPQLIKLYPDAEIVIVDDGSTDDSNKIATSFGVSVVTHPYSKGNGAAIKSGARFASGEILIFMDADGQHQPDDVPHLLDVLSSGYDMVVGARTRESQAGVHRAVANGFYNRFASIVVGHQILDLTSGFRAVRAEKFKEFLHLLPNGFSYPTTTTMCFFRSGYSVAYMPIFAPKRIGKSHINPFKDGIRFMLIIFKIGTLFSPIKIFGPISLFFLVFGLGYYGYTFAAYHRFTNMSGLLLSNAVIVFLMGLVSEQITALMYRK